jgi:hypothetical protein
MKLLATVSLVLIVALSTPQSLLAQAAPQPVRGSWDALKAIPTGAELVVELRGARSVDRVSDRERETERADL